MTASRELDEDISPQISAELHPAVLVARKAWREMWPGMEQDGSADVIVAALAHHGLLAKAGRRRS